MNKNLSIIITGGTGFIGNATIKTLLEQGYKNLITINSQSKYNDTKVHSVVAKIGSATTIKDIINKDDIVVHMAWSCNPSTAEQNRISDIKDNVLSTLELLDICVKKKIRRFIFISSGGTVYGNTEPIPSIESDPLNPKNSYGALKVCVEKYLDVYKQIYGLDYTIIRLANVYGRIELEDKPQWALDIFLKNALEDKPITMRGDGSTVRDYIYIKDVVDFIVKIISDNSLFGIYNLGTGVGTSLAELVQTIETTIHKKTKIIQEPDRKLDLNYNVLNINKALKTGWKPKYNLLNGLSEIINLRKNVGK